MLQFISSDFYGRDVLLVYCSTTIESRGGMVDEDVGCLGLFYNWNLWFYLDNFMQAMYMAGVGNLWAQTKYVFVTYNAIDLNFSVFSFCESSYRHRCAACNSAEFLDIRTMHTHT